MTDKRQNRKPNEKIIQIIVWDGTIMGLSDKGEVYRAFLSGDMKDSKEHKWVSCVAQLEESWEEV